MEVKNIAITLDKAKEWYNSGDESLKEVALQAFTEKELKQFPWENIKTFEGAIKALGMSIEQVQDIIFKIGNTMPMYIGRKMIAQYKLYLIKKALNGIDWMPALNKGKICFVEIIWYLKGYSYPTEYTKIGEFYDKFNGRYYTLVCTDNSYCYNTGLGDFLCEYGDYNANVELLSCKSKEISIHLAKYFGEIMFDAIYGQYDNYKWL